ncbi:hypothetical protein MRX96_055157 [Rhipicephalus microplus]
MTRNSARRGEARSAAFGKPLEYFCGKCGGFHTPLREQRIGESSPSTAILGEGEATGLQRLAFKVQFHLVPQLPSFGGVPGHGESERTSPGVDAEARFVFRENFEP